MTVRFRLREVLERAGLSQSEAARRSGVSFATINRMCTDATARVDLQVMDRLCEALKVTPGELFERVKKGKRG